MGPKPAYVEEAEDEDLNIDAPAVDDEEPDQDDSAILEMLEKDGIEIDDEDLDDEEDGNEAAATLQHPSSVGAKAARFVAARRRKLIWFKRHMLDSEAKLRDETNLEAKLRMQEAGELQPEISDDLRRAPPTAFQTKFASYIENIVNDPARINKSDAPIFTSENSEPPIMWAKAASQWIPPEVQAKLLAQEEPDLTDIGWDDTEDWVVYWCGLLEAIPAHHRHAYLGSATKIGHGSVKGGATARRSGHDSPNCHVYE